MQRVTILPPPDKTSDHLACYGDIDIALDPYPYHGTTTTCEALWMGVPVITLCGDRHASRVGTSLLTAVGHADWIAYDEAEYVRIGTRLATDIQGLAHSRPRLRGDVQASCLFDASGQTQRFFSAVLACADSERNLKRI